MGRDAKRERKGTVAARVPLAQVTEISSTGFPKHPHGAKKKVKDNLKLPIEATVHEEPALDVTQATTGVHVTGDPIISTFHGLGGVSLCAKLSGSDIAWLEEFLFG